MMRASRISSGGTTRRLRIALLCCAPLAAHAQVAGSGLDLHDCAPAAQAVGHTVQVWAPPGMADFNQVREMQAPTAEWRLASVTELRELAPCLVLRGVLTEGLYFTAPPQPESGYYAWYMHYPSLRAVEFGDLFFAAKVIFLKGGRDGETSPH